jgi:hypothetical protein
LLSCLCRTGCRWSTAAAALNSTTDLPQDLPYRTEQVWHSSNTINTSSILVCLVLSSGSNADLSHVQATHCHACIAKLRPAVTGHPCSTVLTRPKRPPVVNPEQLQRMVQRSQLSVLVRPPFGGKTLSLFALSTDATAADVLSIAAVSACVGRNSVGLIQANCSQRACCMVLKAALAPTRCLSSQHRAHLTAQLHSGVSEASLKIDTCSMSCRVAYKRQAVLLHAALSIKVRNKRTLLSMLA